MAIEKLPFRPGDLVQVRPFAEIHATLDTQGRCEGLPFMPEMLQHCGCLFPVYRRAEKVFLDRRDTVVRLKNTVLLEAVRCDGHSHGNCQMGCLTLWKEAWLQPVNAGEATADPRISCRNVTTSLPTMEGEKYCCQATELVHCGPALPWWDCRQYVRDYTARKMRPTDWAGMLALLACNKLRRSCGVQEWGTVVGHLERTNTVRLDLHPGEVVQVKNRREIEATLDPRGTNRGLGFAPEMAQFCEGRFRVLRRVERVIAEWSGELRQITNTVILDGATCSGMARRGCPRDCHHLWRELWLKRVE